MPQYDPSGPTEPEDPLICVADGAGYLLFNVDEPDGECIRSSVEIDLPLC